MRKSLNYKIQKYTISIYCEGNNEEVFCQHLKLIYNKHIKKHITIKVANGGNPESIIQKAIRQMGAFDKRCVILDNDNQDIKEVKRIAKENYVELIENTPCLEAFLLRILEEKSKFNTSENYKNYFQKIIFLEIKE